jgi:hypothetical protein
MHAASAAAGPAGPPRLSVALDWSGVSGQTVEKCLLTGLETLLLQALLEEGYAIVAPGTACELTLHISEKPGRLVVTATSQGLEEQRTIPLPRDCDSTIQLDVVRYARLTLRTLSSRLSANSIPAASLPPAAPGGTTVASEPSAPAAATRGEPLGWWFLAGAGIAGVSLRSQLATVQVTARHPWGRGFDLGGTLELSVGHPNDLWVAEPVLGARVSRPLYRGEGLALAAGAGAGLLVHAYSGPQGKHGGFTTGRLEVPIEIVMARAHLALTIMPYWRMTPVTHLRGETTIFRADRAGASLFLQIMID